ncbi:hypothetical protein [Embleya sp. NPDC001921]
MTKRHIIASALAALGLVVGATAGSAQAGTSNVKNCRPGHLCVYDSRSEDGPNRPVFFTEGNLNDARILATGVFNNGTPSSGADHIWFSGRYAFGSIRGCLHFHTGGGSPDSGTFADLTRIPDSWRGVYVTGAWWGGECTSDRPVLQYNPIDGAGTNEWYTVQR